jgi:hypothetical protein
VARTAGHVVAGRLIAESHRACEGPVQAAALELRFGPGQTRQLRNLSSNENPLGQPVRLDGPVSALRW